MSADVKKTKKVFEDVLNETEYVNKYDYNTMLDFFMFEERITQMKKDCYKTYRGKNIKWKKNSSMYKERKYELLAEKEKKVYNKLKEKTQKTKELIHQNQMEREEERKSRILTRNNGEESIRDRLLNKLKFEEIKRLETESKIKDKSNK